MNTIDQRILIPTPPDVVWEYLGDLTKTPEWQADCKSVSFLTSKRSGPGTRMRMGSDKGQDRVVEITAWYDGLGYQYTYVDGMPFKESTGRIRLQEIPEGTVVQWTFTYDVGGLRFGLGRQIEASMETSLKALWKQVSQTGSAQKIREAKSLMRDAPDYEARAQYKPRHPAVVDIKVDDESKENAQYAGPTQPIPAVPMAPVVPASRLLADDEPPISDEDTRPRPAVKAAVEPSPALFQRPEPEELFDTTDEPDFSFRPVQSGLPDELFETTAEPDFLDAHARFAPPVEPAADTQPIKPITAADLAKSDVPDEARQTADYDFDFDMPAVTLPVTDEAPAVSAETAIEEAIHAPETDLVPVAPEAGPVAIDQPEDLIETPSMDVTVPVTPTEAPTQAVEPPKPIRPREDISKRDTAKMSIWEIFGVERPTDAPPAVPEPVTPMVEPPPIMAEIVDAVEADATVPHVADAAPAPEPVAAVEPSVHSIRSYDLPADASGQRGGLRLRMRRKTVKLRFPQ